MGDSLKVPGFMMLSERMCDIFSEYIEEGRLRAPPENELHEMIPTFQFGAKTDRRALQSKFKSWAKRMHVENGNLILTSSGKKVISKEQCINLVMDLHSDEHINVETIISEVKKTHAWSKKNFGMDREFVVEAISRNCTREDCVRKMMKTFWHYDFMKGSPSLLHHPVLPDFTKMTPMPPLRFSPAYPHQLPFPVAIPMPPPTNLPLPPSFMNSQFRFNFANHTKAKVFNLKHSGIKAEEIPNAARAQEPVSEEFPLTKFQKSGNINDYKTLMEAVKRSPNFYPKVLASKKTQFLSHLGIVPKAVCTTKTLKRFRKERKRKMALNSDLNAVYRSRKALRDRNKLRQNSGVKRVYMEVLSNNGGLASLKNKHRSEKSHGKESRYMKYRVKKAKADACSKLGLKGEPSSGKIEVIDIVSSEDEANKENVPPNKEPCSTAAIDSTPASKHQDRVPIPVSHTIREPLDLSEAAVKVEGIENQKGNGATSQKIYIPVPGNYFLPLQVRSQTTSWPKRLLLPKNANSCPDVEKSSVFLPAAKRLHPDALVSEETKKSNGVFSRVIPIHIGPRQPIPTNDQLRPHAPAPYARNITPRLIYPVLLSKNVQNTKLLVVEKGASNPLLIAPHSVGQHTLQTVQSTPPTSNEAKAAVVPEKDSRNSPKEKIVLSKLYDSLLEASIKKGSEENKNIADEMKRISNWIQRMKSAINPTMFQSGIEKSAQKIVVQLDVGLGLVRDAKKALQDIEQEIDLREKSDASDK